MSFSSKIREVPWANNRLFWSSIKSSFQRIKNHQLWRSVWRVMVKSFNTARSEIPLDRLQHCNKTNITSLSGVQLGRMTTCWKDNLMTMSKDDWKAMYAKDDDLKLTKARGKIRRTMTPPIFSSGMLDILLIEWCYQGRKPFGSSTRSTGASSNPDTLGKTRTMEKTHHWSRYMMVINGDDLEA